MATAAQIAANCLNAQKSTGPRTPAGKAAIRFNALQHGLDAASILIPGEDPEEYDRVVDNYTNQFCPRSRSKKPTSPPSSTPIGCAAVFAAFKETSTGSSAPNTAPPPTSSTPSSSSPIHPKPNSSAASLPSLQHSNARSSALSTP